MGCCVGNCCVMDCGFCCILDFCSDSGCDYHPVVNNTVSHAKNIADDTVVMKKRARENGRKLGQEALTSINAYMDEMMAFLAQYNQKDYGGKKLNLHLDSVKQEIAGLQKEVLDFIGNRMDEKLVETDPELSVILQEWDDDKRKKRFDEYYDRTYRQAVKDLTEKIEEVVGKQFAIVQEEIDARLGEVQQSMNKAMKDYDEAMAAMKKQEELPKEQIKAAEYEIALADTLQKELQDGVPAK